MSTAVLNELVPFEYQNFSVKTLRIESEVLKKNPLRDPSIRLNPVLLPKAKTKDKNQSWPLVLVLAGLGSNGSKSFIPKGFDKNLPQELDQAVTESRAPQAVYVFVDAFTFWGGSQFIDSQGCGLYEQYIMKELLPAIEAHFDVEVAANKRVVTGSSSGGYGALHLCSRYPHQFGVCGALAPDSDFQTSLLPDLWGAASTLKKIGVRGVKKEIEEGRFFRRKDAFKVQLAIAMASCYSPDKKISEKTSFPIDLETGEVIKPRWKAWCEKDPLVFLKKRKTNVQRLKKVYLDVGKKDEFNLMFGARKMKTLLESMKAPLTYSEFDGGHFDMGPRRLVFWEWLHRMWR